MCFHYPPTRWHTRTVVRHRDQGVVLRRVLLVEDHRLIAATLAAALESRGYQVGQCATLSAEGIVATAREFGPDVILLDHDLGRELPTSIPLITELLATGARVLMLTATEGRELLAEAVEAGAHGLLTKSEPLDGLVDAIEDAVANGSLVSPSQRQQLLAELRQHREEQRARIAPFLELTPREQEVLAALVEGQTAQAIADATFTSIRTVRGHIQTVLDKLGVSSQLTAVVKARAAGWRAPRKG